MLETDKLDLKRITIHRVTGKDIDTEHGDAIYTESLFEFGFDEMETLKNRIGSAFSRTKRFFKLEIAKIDKGSFFDNAKNLHSSTKEEFLTKSKNIADLLAISHNKRTIPSGLLLIMDGLYENSLSFTIVIKAELQEAFTIVEDDGKKLIELINDLFLSPAKDFYKIGFLMQDINPKKTFPNSDFSAYMYDDNFSSGKRNLAEYFYDTFLGFSTSSNDKLLTKNFYEDVGTFINENVAKFDDKKGLRNALNTLYREDTTGVINPQEFAEKHFPEELLRKFGSEVGFNYAHSFTKDLELVENKLRRGKIKLINELKIEGPTDSLDEVRVLTGSSIDFNALKLSIESGEIDQVVTISTDKSLPITIDKK